MKYDKFICASCEQPVKMLGSRVGYLQRIDLRVRMCPPCHSQLPEEHKRGKIAKITGRIDREGDRDSSERAARARRQAKARASARLRRRHLRPAVSNRGQAKTQDRDVGFFEAVRNWFSRW